MTTSGTGPLTRAADEPSVTAATAALTAGLTVEEARRRLEADGPNVLPRPRRPSAARHLIAQWTHFFALLLWVAAGLAVIAGMPQLAVAIAIVVLINGLFASLQERRAERAADRLQDLMPLRATVRRAGAEHAVDAAELVVDDVVVLRAGDRVCADALVLEATALAVDTSMMTGESVPDHPEPGSRVCAGTFVVEGEATARVSATGSHTELAALAALTAHAGRRSTPLTIEIDRLVRVIALVSVGVGGLFFGVSLLVGMPPEDGFLFGIGVTVALVPEGLLPTVTLSLAVGAQRMARSHALVRRLDSVETLGSTTFICTDKTGTLTRNEMTLVDVWTPGGALAVTGAAGYDPTTPLTVPAACAGAIATALVTARACSDGRAVRDDATATWHAVGDPMEAAIDVLVRRVGGELPGPPVRRYPFDPRRRRMSVALDHHIAVKGAPDSVLPRTADAADAEAARVVVEAFAARGRRTLAVARREWSGPLAADADGLETDLELVGILAFEDPPRPTAAGAIAACRRAGIRVAMITGDHPGTAAAIAGEVGLAPPGATVLIGAELPDDEALLAATVDRDGAVVARVSPQDKLRIAAALRSRGHVVAMTGDGVNDGPALREADIGVAMGRTGTDVAREASDLVLLDDDFATIVRAVEQGRATFRNLRRFLTYHLTDNVAELTPFAVWALSGGRFPLAIGVLQVLALDIGTDLLPALALGAEPPRPGLLDAPPTQGRLMDEHVVRRAFGRLGPAEATVAMASFVAVLLANGWRPGDEVAEGPMLATASGAAFMSIVLGQLATAFACRSTTRWVGAVGWRGNPLLLGAVAVELAMLAAFLVIGPLADVLEHQVPSLLGAAVGALSVPMIVAVDAIDKRRGHARRVG